MRDTDTAGAATARRECALLASLFRMNLRALLTDSRTFWSNVLLMAVNNALYMLLWIVFFGRFGAIGGFDLKAIFVLQGFVSAGFGIFVVFGGGARDLARRIADGSLEVWLLHPRSVVVQALGSRSQSSGWGDIATGVVYMTLGGAFDDPSRGAAVALGVCSAAIAFAAIGIGYGALGCWFEDADSLMRQIFDFTLTFSLWPESIFGGALRFFLYTILPAGIVSFVPYAAVRAASPLHAAGGLVLAVLFFAAATAFLSRGVRRYAG